MLLSSKMSSVASLFRIPSTSQMQKHHFYEFMRKISLEFIKKNPKEYFFPYENLVHSFTKIG